MITRNRAANALLILTAAVCSTLFDGPARAVAIAAVVVAAIAGLVHEVRTH